MQPYAIAAGYSSWGRWQSRGEWYQRRCRLSETRPVYGMGCDDCATMGEALTQISKSARSDKNGVLLYQREVRPRVPYQVAAYGGYALFDTETEAYMHWQSEHAALSDCSGINPKGARRRWKPGTLINVVNGTKPALHFIDQQELF